MRRVVWIALLIASPALADDDACFELGGQGIAPCATPKGHVAIESNLTDWIRDGHGADRTDTLSLAASIARIGLGGLTEGRISVSPLILTRSQGRRWIADFGDLTIGAKHQFGKDGPVGLALQFTIPTGGSPAGQQLWSAEAILPVQVPLNKLFTLDLTAAADAAPNASGHGRHFQWSMVAGTDITPSEALTITADVKRQRDNDPLGHITQTSASLSIGWHLAKRAQLTLGGVAGLDHDAPQAEAYLGAAVLF